MIELLTDPQAWIALATLTALEIVLGVDNIIFLSVIAGRLPVDQRDTARRIGLALAMGLRILLLLSITWIMSLEAALFTILGEPFNTRDLILIGGGLFLLAKSTLEIHAQLEGPEPEEAGKKVRTFTGVLVQIAVVDLVFSIDSVITAVGMVDEVEIMIAAVVIAVGVMMVAAAPVGRFVDEHPTIKMLALSFLILVGLALMADGFGMHIPKGYIYFAMAFSFGVEMLNLRLRKKRGKKVVLKRQYEHTTEGGPENAPAPAGDGS